MLEREDLAETGAEVGAVEVDFGPFGGLEIAEGGLGGAELASNQIANPVAEEVALVPAVFLQQPVGVPDDAEGIVHEAVEVEVS